MTDKDTSIDFISELECMLKTIREPSIINEEPMITQTKPPLSSGDIADDGSIFLGVYNDKDWFVTAQDIKHSDGSNLRLSFNEAAKYIKNFKAHGHDDWVVPTGSLDGMWNSENQTNILKEMYNHKSTGAFNGTYNERPQSVYKCYLSATHHPSDWNTSYRTSFDDGRSFWYSNFDCISVRPVRSQPHKPS
jgi:hypothetical protein